MFHCRTVVCDGNTLDVAIWDHTGHQCTLMSIDCTNFLGNTLAPPSPIVVSEDEEEEEEPQLGQPTGGAATDETLLPDTEALELMLAEDPDGLFTVWSVLEDPTFVFDTTLLDDDA